MKVIIVLFGSVLHWSHSFASLSLLSLSLSLSLSLLFVFSPPKLDWILSPQPRRELPTPWPLRRRRAVLLRPVLRFDWLGEGTASVERMTS